MAIAEVDEVLQDVTLSSVVAGPRTANLVQTLAPATLASTGVLGRVLHGNNMQTAEAKLVSTVTLGTRPDNPPMPPRLFNLTGKIRSDGGAVLVFVGPPNRTVDWRLLEGSGTLTPYSTFTDELGRCSCRFDAAGITGRVVVGAAYVP